MNVVERLRKHEKYGIVYSLTDSRELAGLAADEIELQKKLIKFLREGADVDRDFIEQYRRQVKDLKESTR